MEEGLRALLSVSQGVKKRLRNILTAIERDPSSFDELEDVPLDLSLRPGVTIRKAKVIQGKHDFRIVFILRQLDDGSEHVDLLYVFKRKAEYQIDWDWIASMLEG